MSELQGKSMIGSRLGAGNAETFHGVNPATGGKLEPSYHAASAEEVQEAARLAAEAFSSYRKTTGVQRAAFLRMIADNIEAIGDSLVERMVQETALPETRARAERGRTAGQLRMFADLVEEGSWVNARIDHADPTRTPIPKPDTRFMLQALGPVAVFGPANFPLAFSVAGGDTASALAAGCPVVVKGHSSHPGTSELVGQAVRAAVRACGLHEGVFSLLFGSGSKIGTTLVKDPAIKAVGFTGSKNAGRALFDLAAARSEPIPVFAEMSSSNPVFILPRALAERGDKIAEGLQGSVTLGVGQFCTNPGLVMVNQGDAADALAARLSDLMASSPGGVMLNKGTRKAYEEGVRRLGGHHGVSALVGGESQLGAGEAQAAAAVFRTSAESFLSSPELTEEVFGPSTLLVVSQAREELLRIAEGLEGQLTATVHGTDEDIAEYRDLVALLETKVGRLLFNGYPTGVEVGSSMNHSGPYPATTDCRFTSVGTAAIYRFARPLCYQNCPDSLLPVELQEGNPRGIWRWVDGRFAR